MKTKILNTIVAAAVFLAAATAARAQYAYSNAVMSLNPAGYWPMHEVEAAAAGDVETNFGTLGLLGTGFYPDWVTGNGAGIKRGQTGAIAGSPDTSVEFTRDGNLTASGATTFYTNTLYVPRTSPLVTLNPPFTIECWINENATASEFAYGQFGFNAFNGAGLGNGGPASNTNSYNGLGLNYNGSFQVYGEANGVQTATASSSAVAINQWVHVVVTCDQYTNITLWTNGYASGATFTGVGKYIPDRSTPLTIGGTRGGTRTMGGYIDEFAVYTNAITDIYQHYSDGTNVAPATSYFHDVTNDNALIYLRMDAPAGAYSPPPVANWPALNNYGTTNGIAVGNGFYTPGTMPGIVTNPMVNPSGMPFGGVTNILAQLSGVSSFGDAGSAAAYNPTGSNANFTVTAIFRGNPCDNRVQSIAGHGTNSWQVSMSTNGLIVFNAGNGNSPTEGIGQAAGDLKTVGVYNDGNWHQVVAINSTNVISIYVDGALDTSGTPAGITTTNQISGNTGDMMIGSDPSYTNNPPGVGRSFAGQVCDVAFFTNALTLSQVQMLYSNCEVAPYITTQPISANVNAAAAFTNTVVAHGSGTLSYQWFTNGVAFGGQTSASLILNPAVAADTSTNYYVVVKGNYGSVTSAVVSLTVYAAPAFVTQFPVTYSNILNASFLNLYAGANPSFLVSTKGAQPISYQWFTNGVAFGGQTNASVTLTNVQAGSITNYCVATNFVGATTGTVWIASVIADPVGAGDAGLAPYPQTVLSNNPIAYWRLNEPDDGNADGNPGAIAFDYAGGNDGIYTNVGLGFSGYSPTTDPSDTSVELGLYGSFLANNYAGQIMGIDFAASNGVNGEFTVEAWVNGKTTRQVTGGAVIAQGEYGINDAFNLGLDSQAAHNFEFYVRNAANSVVAADSTFPPDGNWHHLVGVCDEANSNVSLYIDGHLAATNPIPANSGVYEASAPVSIGAGTADGVSYSNQFQGYLNDVAVYKHALTGVQIASQYVSLGVPPYLSPAPPGAVNINNGGNLAISITAVGSPALGYQWQITTNSVSSTLGTGTTNGPLLNASLTINGVPAGWSGGTLELTVTNAYGTTNVFVGVIVNTNLPLITLNLPSPVTVVSRQSYVYSIYADSEPPVGYQWYQAGAAVSGATNSSYTTTAGAPGNTTFYVVITNLFGSATSSVSTFTSVSATAPPLTSGYETNVLLLKPAGFWPMHETQAAANGDIEVNYGSLGLLGTGYYPDWVPANAGGITHGVIPGALAYDPDACAGFNNTIITTGAEWTNALYVPHTSPLSTLNPPFTVECWCYPFNVTGGQSVWAQFGFAGLNAGNSGSGNGNYDGAYFVYNGSFTIYGEDNGVQTAIAGQPGNLTTPVNSWYHLVVTVDANTNFTVYVNGLSGGSASGVGKYTPDYWTPMTIANGRGPNRAMTCGLDEFAVYTNVITDIAQHYTNGLYGGPGAYFKGVTNDNPLIYFRMDSSAYSQPGVTNWPVLFNYGSAGINGYYTPGTIPGIVAGPSTNASGAPFNGLSGNVPQLSGVSSFADAGYAPVFDPTGPTPFSVSAVFRGNPCDGRFQDIAGHSDSSWRIAMNINGHLQCSMGIDPSNVVNSAGLYNDGNWHQVVDVYTPATNPNLKGTNSLYVDGILDTNVTGVNTNGIGPGSPLDVMIGSDPQYTNNPSGVGRQFAGQVCDVALFTNALSAGQVQALYVIATQSTNIPAFLAPAPPIGATANPGGTLNVSAGVAGTPPLYYQWHFTTNGGGTSVVATGSGNGVPLNATLNYPNVSTNWNNGQLELTVTNAYGTNTAFVTLSIVNTVNTNPTNIVFSMANNQLTLSWPADHTGWQLQAQTNSLEVGISTNWVNVSGSVGTNLVVIPINLTNGSVFYRLVYP